MGFAIGNAVRLLGAAAFLFLAFHAVMSALGVLRIAPSAGCGGRLDMALRVATDIVLSPDEIADDDPLSVCTGVALGLRAAAGDENPRDFLNDRVTSALGRGDTYFAMEWVSAAPVLGLEYDPPEDVLYADIRKDYEAARDWKRAPLSAAKGALGTFRCDETPADLAGFGGAVGTDILLIGDVRDVIIYGCATIPQEERDDAYAAGCKVLWTAMPQCRAVEPDPIVLGLAGVGAAASVVTFTGVGTAAGGTAATGASAAKIARKARRLDGPLAREIAENASGIVKTRELFDVLSSSGGDMVLLRLKKIGKRINEEAIDQAKLAKLKPVLSDIDVLTGNLNNGQKFSGIIGASYALKYTPEPSDLKAFRQLSDVAGSKPLLLARYAEESPSAAKRVRLADGTVTAKRLARAAKIAWKYELWWFFLWLSIAATSLLGAFAMLTARRRAIQPF